VNSELLRAFLADCKANPLDDVPRLILADWLEEHGETEADRARGHLIRLQVSVENGTDPRASPEIDRLCRMHKDAWLGPLARVGPIRSEHRRGLLHISSHAENLLTGRFRSAVESPAWSWVEGLHLKGSHQRLPLVFREPYLRGISHLSVDRQDRDRTTWLDEMLASGNLGALVGLDLNWSALAPVQAWRLANWPGLVRLRHLNLAWSGLGDDGLAGLLSGSTLANLRVLNLSSAGLTQAGVEALFRSPHVPALVHLELSGNTLGRDWSAQATEPAFAPNLRRLGLALTRMGDTGVSALAAMNLPALRELNLTKNHLSPTSVAVLVGAKWLTQLEVLTLGENALGAALSPVLTAPLTSLRRLGLGSNVLDARAVADLVASPHLEGLRELLLSYNRLGDEGARLLTGWPGLARLTYVDLASNGITAEGLLALLRSPHLGPDTSLQLERNVFAHALPPELRRVARSLGGRIHLS
jgi:uncharacterized protein (TIGR02996 family)